MSILYVLLDYNECDEYNESDKPNVRPSVRCELGTCMYTDVYRWPPRAVGGGTQIGATHTKRLQPAAGGHRFCPGLDLGRHRQ